MIYSLPSVCCSLLYSKTRFNFWKRPITMRCSSYALVYSCHYYAQFNHFPIPTSSFIFPVAQHPNQIFSVTSSFHFFAFCNKAIAALSFLLAHVKTCFSSNEEQFTLISRVFSLPRFIFSSFLFLRIENASEKIYKHI